MTVWDLGEHGTDSGHSSMLSTGEHPPGQEIMFAGVNTESDNNADGSF